MSHLLHKSFKFHIAMWHWMISTSPLYWHQRSDFYTPTVPPELFRHLWQIILPCPNDFASSFLSESQVRAGLASVSQHFIEVQPSWIQPSCSWLPWGTWRTGPVPLSGTALVPRMSRQLTQLYPKINMICLPRQVDHIHHHVLLMYLQKIHFVPR